MTRILPVKRTVHISGIHRNQAGSKLWKSLFAMFPEVAQSATPHAVFSPKGEVYEFRCCVMWSDPRISKLKRLLEGAGWVPEFSPELDSIKRYAFCCGHIYDDRDFASWELLRLQPEHFYEVITDWNHGDGKLLISYTDLRSRGKRGFNFGNAQEIIVSASMRKAIMRAELRGVKFRRALLNWTGPGRAEGGCDVLSWSAMADGPWCEMTSSVVLPPLTERTPLRGSKGGPVSADFSTGCWEMPVGFEMPGFHYARSALKKLPEFDVARTYEHFGYYTPIGHPHGWQREVIVSQRFYQFAKANKLRVEWWPVHIDEDL